MLLLIAALSLCATAATATSFDSPGNFHASTVELLGTLLLKNGDRSHKVALIRVNDEDARWFAVNQNVTRDIALVDVALRHVVLRHNGNLLQLKFSSRTSVAAPLPEQSPPPVPALPAHANALSTPVPGIVYLSDTHFKVSRKVMTDYLYSFEGLRDNRASLLDEGGLFITRIRADSVLEKTGLRVGDILTAVDGKPLKNLSDVQRLLNQLTESKKPQRIDLELTRSGMTQHLTYDLTE